MAEGMEGTVCTRHGAKPGPARATYPQYRHEIQWDFVLQLRRTLTRKRL